MIDSLPIKIGVCIIDYLVDFLLIVVRFLIQFLFELVLVINIDLCIWNVRHDLLLLFQGLFNHVIVFSSVMSIKFLWIDGVLVTSEILSKKQLLKKEKI